MGGTGLATGALNDREFGHGQTAAIGSKAVRAGAFIKDSSLDQAEATKRPWRNPSVSPQVTVRFQGLFAFLFFTDNTFEQCGPWRPSCAQRPRPWSPKMIR